MGRGIRKLTVLILLTMASVDLVWPGFCPAEQVDLTGIPCQESGAYHSDDGQRSPDPVKPREDDCFCCCSHVVPSAITTIEQSLVIVSHLHSESQSRPALLPHTFFHPPRSV